jgi:hypothetical protein
VHAEFVTRPNCRGKEGLYETSPLGRAQE